jgi:tRNA 2-selenouridine synthase
LSPDNIRTEIFEEFFLRETPLVDVRAPVEFDLGSLPNSVNLPLLNNEERARIGTAYKSQGSEAAVELGHLLIAGRIKQERIDQWLNYFKSNPNAVIYCFRGGLRSQITQQWLKEAGIERPIIIGGYKSGRQFLMEQIQKFSTTNKLLSLYGPTGSGKTQFIQEIKTFYPTIDLEALALHRGSAFGALLIPQPSQINFENQLAMKIMALKKHIFCELPILVEDESRLIGRCILPNSFFINLQQSPVLWLDESLEQRVENIFQEYIRNSPIGSLIMESALQQFDKYQQSLQSISKKLGGLRTSEILTLIENAKNIFIQTRELEQNRKWIEKLLVYYYDPLYLQSIERRQIKVVFKGSKSECLAYLKNGDKNATS